MNYGSSIYSSAAVLNDVTSGSNGSCGGTYFCNAVTGYDGPTGPVAQRRDSVLENAGLQANSPGGAVGS